VALGPGKYDDLTTLVMERTKADGAILIVIGGALGHGFSVQADARTALNLPKLLRQIADDIEQDAREDAP